MTITASQSVGSSASSILSLQQRIQTELQSRSNQMPGTNNERAAEIPGTAHLSPSVGTRLNASA